MAAGLGCVQTHSSQTTACLAVKLNMQPVENFDLILAPNRKQGEILYDRQVDSMI